MLRTLKLVLAAGIAAFAGVAHAADTLHIYNWN